MKETITIEVPELKVLMFDALASVCDDYILSPKECEVLTEYMTRLNKAVIAREVK